MFQGASSGLEPCLAPGLHWVIQGEVASCYLASLGLGIIPRPSGSTFLQIAVVVGHFGSCSLDGCRNAQNWEERQNLQTGRLRDLEGEVDSRQCWKHSRRSIRMASRVPDHVRLEWEPPSHFPPTFCADRLSLVLPAVLYALHFTNLSCLYLSPTPRGQRLGSVFYPAVSQHPEQFLAHCRPFVATC